MSRIVDNALRSQGRTAPGSSSSPPPDLDTRVLFVADVRHEVEALVEPLAAVGLCCDACENFSALAREIERGVGAVLLTEPSLTSDDFAGVLAALNRQPAWSDVPVVVLMSHDESDTTAVALRALRNVVLLESSASARSVVSVVQSAIHARKLQYEVREQASSISHANDERQRLLKSEAAARRESDRVRRVKDDFLAALSHELRTPLTPVLMAVAAHETNPALPQIVREDLKMIRRNVELEAKLIDDLLDLRRSTGKRPSAVKFADDSSASQTEQPSPAATAARTAARPLRLMLVEDHPDTAFVLSRLLTLEGHSVQTVNTAADALALAGEHSFDLVISDLGLPDMTGYDLMKQIRHRHGLKGIAMSGYGMEDDVRRSIVAGFSDHLVKPVTLDRLEQSIRRVASNGSGGDADR